MELYTVFFILAALLLIVLGGYSVWSARREKSRIFLNDFSTRGQPPVQNPSQTNVPSFAQNTEVPVSAQPEQIDETVVAQEVERSLNNIKISLGEQLGEPAAPAPQPTYHAEPAPSVQREPEPVQTVETAPAQSLKAPQTLLLYVVAPQNAEFKGQDIVNRLEEMGLLYDPESQFFHRHIDTLSSPVIFGVANMHNPGTIDLNTLHRFTTAGLIFFMTTPSGGNDQANLRSMISDAEMLAQSLNGFVLDDQGNLFTPETRLTYLQRV